MWNSDIYSTDASEVDVVWNVDCAKPHKLSAYCDLILPPARLPEPEVRQSIFNKSAIINEQIQIRLTGK